MKPKFLFFFTVWLKTYNYIVFTRFQRTKLYSFENITLGFIREVSLDVLKKCILIKKKKECMKNK